MKLRVLPNEVARYTTPTSQHWMAKSEVQRAQVARSVRGPDPENGGSGGIRTHGTLSRTAVFKTAAFNHSATLP